MLFVNAIENRADAQISPQAQPRARKRNSGDGGPKIHTAIPMPRRFSTWIAGSSPAMIKSLPNSVEAQQRGAMALSHASEFSANVLEVYSSLDANIVEK